MMWVEEDIVSIIVAIIAVVIAAITAWALWRQLASIKNSQDSETLRNTLSSLHAIYDSEDKIRTKEDCEWHAIKLLDLMSMAAYLMLKKKANEELMDFLKFDMGIALTTLHWFHDKKLDAKYKADASLIWSNLTKYCEKRHICQADKETLPRPLLNFDRLESPVFVYGELLDSITRKKIIGRDVETVDDVLDGHSKEYRVEVEGHTYPTAIRSESSIDGKILMLLEDEIGKVDEWETEAYRRIKVNTRNGISAWMYIERMAQKKRSS